MPQSTIAMIAKQSAYFPTRVVMVYYKRASIPANYAFFSRSL